VQASTVLTDIFGDALDVDGRTASMREGTGAASLGLYQPPGRARVDRSFGKLRITLKDGELGALSLPLTDLRLYDLELRMIHERRVELLEDRIRRRNVLLSVGVGRAWAPEGDEPRHWLQVNNIHVDDDPCGQGVRPRD